MNTALKTKDTTTVKTKDGRAMGDLSDWGLLSEINEKQSKLVIKPKTRSSVNISSLTKNLINVAEKDDELIAQNNEVAQEVVNESFTVKSANVDSTLTPVNESMEVVKATTPEKEASVKQVKVEKIAKPVVQHNFNTNVLLKLIAIGLTKLYVKKTSTVLNPVKFMIENYKAVLIAIMHLGIPLLMTWFLLTHVEFITAQLAEVATPVFWGYAVVFYAASLFTWITGQVLLAGVLSMFKSTLINVAINTEKEID